MAQSRSGMSSCIIFVLTLVLACSARLTINAMKPERPDHMDMSGVAVLFVAVIVLAVIAVMQIVGVVLGIVALRQTAKNRSAGQVGAVLNGAGLLCTILTTLFLMFGSSH